MKISTYNPVDMSLISEDVTGISFSNAVRGGYSSPVVIKPGASDGETLSQIALFLEDEAGLAGSTFRSLKSSAAISGIGSGSSYLSDSFAEQNGISDFTNFSTISGDGQVFSASDPEYVWLDVRVGAADTIGSANVNYRFIFEYA